MISDLLEASKALLTPLVAMIAVYVAFRQWQTAHQKIVLDLFERRLVVFTNTLSVVTGCIRTGEASLEDVNKMRDAYTRAQFLFERDVSFMLDRIFDDVIWINHYNEQMLSTDEDRGRRSELRKEKANRFRSLSAFVHGDGVQAFKPYMKCAQKQGTRSLLPRRIRPGRFD